MAVRTKTIHNPHTGRSTLVNEIDTDNPEFDSITIDTTATEAYGVGKLRYTSQERTYSIGMPGGNSELNLGMESYLPRGIYNNTGSTLENGTLIYVNGGSGSNFYAGLANASSGATSINTIAMITEDIPNGSTGLACTKGLVRGSASQPINTSSYSAGDQLFLSASTSGTFTGTMQTHPNYCVRIGTVLYSHATNGAIAVKIESPIFASRIAGGDNAVWNDIRIAAENTRLQGGSDPDYLQFKTNGSGSNGVYAYRFDATTPEEVFFSVQIPHNYMLGSDLDAHVHWVPTADGTSGQVVSWGLEYTIANIGDVFGNTSIAYGNTHIPADDVLAQDKHYLTEVTTIDGSGIDSVSTMLMCRLFRDAGGAGKTDDYASDAALLEFDLHYQIDSLGSRSEYSKD